MIDSYATLQAAVARWLKRSDLAADIPDFIRLAELDINRRLTIVPKEALAPLVAVPGSRFVTLPADFGSPIELAAVSPRCEFTPMTAASLPVDDTRTAHPRYWAIDGTRIAFECKADRPHVLELRYLQTVLLSDQAPTNAVFTRAPDLYLYGALAHSAPYIHQDERLPMWQQKFEALLRAVAAEGARAISMAPLQTELTGAMCRSSNTRYWG